MLQVFLRSLQHAPEVTLAVKHLEVEGQIMSKIHRIAQILRFTTAITLSAWAFTSYVATSQAATSQAVTANAAPRPAVTVSIIEQQQPSRALQYLGRIEAIQAVDVTTRTEGFIAHRHFTEGQMVKAGDLLYEIDPVLHHATVAQAQAQLDSAQATARHAQVNLSRLQQLGANRSVSKADIDAAQSQRDTARAAVAQAEASLKVQQLQLGFTRITAPISGRIGHSNFNTGSLINPASGALVHIVQLDPIRVTIAINERDYIAAAYQQPKGAEDLSASRFVPRIQLANGKRFSEAGTFESVDNRIDSQTGTVAVRARFANPRHLLLPGGVVNVELMSEEQNAVIMVPIAALQQDKQGFSVLVVDAEDRVVVRPIQVGAQHQQYYEVKEGLSVGERVIVAGLQRVQPGMLVSVSLSAPASAQ